MKKIICICFISLLFSCVAYAQDKVVDELFQEKTQTYILRQAALDLQENQNIYVQMLEHVDGATGLAWMRYLGQEIPSQPIAVIEILSLTQYNIKSICPAFFPEDTEDSIINAWNANAIQVLSAFTMTDSGKESIRKSCLDNIKRIDTENRKNIK